MIRRQIALLVLAMLAAVPLLARAPIAITGARILNPGQAPLATGTIVIQDGKIVAIGAHVAVPKDAQVIDGRGKVVMPGLFDAGNQLGLIEVPFVGITDDSTEYTDPIHPELRVADAFNARSENIRVARPGGVTYSLVTPAGGNLIAGQSAVIQLDGDSAAQMLLRAPAALRINLGEASKETYGSHEKAPKTRMAEMAMLRQAFLRAQHAQAEKSAARDLKTEALLAALNREIPVVVHANRLGDIESALRLAEEFNLRLVLAEAASAWRIADQLAARKIPVIVGPIQRAPGRNEEVDKRLDNAALLHKAGVVVALQSLSSNGVRDLWIDVAYLLANGVAAPDALAMVTMNPATIFGLQERAGSLEAGKDATLVLLDGEPFQVNTHVLKVFIAGSDVSLTNHQTELYEQYKKKYGIQ